MSLRPWILAARPKTLPAAVAPVLVGAALAAHDGVFAVLPALICLVFALLIQIGANYANDYYDYVQGADPPERVGPTRAVASGLVSPAVMKRATWAVLTLAFVVGMSLVWWGGWWLVVVGVASVTGALAYTGGPYPLGYHGWGDAFVFVFFGLVAVAFTYYVQAGAFSPAAWWLGAAVGALSTNLLVVNNYRDADTDRVAGKHTLVVRWGRSAARVQYALSVVLALAVPIAMALQGRDWSLLLPVAMAPLGMQLVLRLRRARTRDDFQQVLAWTAQMLLFTSVLIALGLVA